jgi:predicted PurR-regulated permease PerM
MDSTNLRGVAGFIRFVCAILGVAVLYWGRDMIVPLALAALLAFMLSPLVRTLCRVRVPRALAVGMVTVVVFSTLALVMWLLGREVHHLASELPKHRENIQQRVAVLQTWGQGGLVGKLRGLANDISNKPAAPAPSSPAPATPSSEYKTSENSAAPHETKNDAPVSPANDKQAAGSNGGVLANAMNVVLTTLADALSTAGLVILFVIFMLLRQEDIAQRVVRLVGFSRLTLTAKALDEVGERVSRYLLMQFTINSIYGLLLAGGLFFIGLPYVVLWGVLAAMFRFIPYVGPWIVAVLPIGLSLAVFDGWTQPLLVISLIVTLELVTNMFIEPLLYGQSAGVSDFALLLTLTFWTWLWGGIGLILATPLTVCLVVFCKYIPSLEWVEILMGDKVQPQAHLQMYQRVLADDEQAALTLIRESTATSGVERTLDEVALPALALARREAVLGRLEREEERAIYNTMRSALALLKNEDEEKASPVAEVRTDRVTKRVLGRALNGEADAQALEMLAQALPDALEMDVSSAPQLVGEWMQKISDEKPPLVCISAMPPGAQLAASVLCRRLKKQMPETRILACRWALPGQEHDAKPLLDAGATWVATSITEAVKIIQREAIG